MTTRWIEIDAGGGEHYDGYLALPRAGKGPGVVIVQEIFGVNAHIRSVAEQYALAGYVAFAPDIFWRGERRVELGYEGADRDKALALLKGLDVEKTVADLGAAAKTLRAQPETTGKIGAVGFCFGGQLAYLMAARGTADAAVAYYGGGIQNKLDEADKIRAPIMFHYAEHDSSIPQTAVSEVKKRFAAHPNALFFDYPGVQHGFNCSDRSAYDQHASALAHGRTLEFLSSNL
ncbi:dienelactone hydrolase family protein [Trinickia dinghuensis]|uniref:dienelactone hydrolase family protein n=1 Tax=Trinickia dinghuensis TaxID=2291023 RepID=UPI0015F12AFC|nr:dienelactone hydrolase family protein [Trinickia dinghuensis]